MTTSIADNLINLAAKFRSTSPEYETGVVLIVDNKAIGWSATLCNPEDEKIGTIAVDYNNTIYIVIAGCSTSETKIWIECDELSDYSVPW